MCTDNKKYGVINGHTKLASGISLAKFLGGYGDPKDGRIMPQIKFCRTTESEKLSKNNRHHLQASMMLKILRTDKLVQFQELSLIASRKKLLHQTIFPRRPPLA